MGLLATVTFDPIPDDGNLPGTVAGAPPFGTTTDHSQVAASVGSLTKQPVANTADGYSVHANVQDALLSP